MSAASQHIGKTLAELLHQHNCVIIPNFGALVGNRVAAYLDENKNIFNPPYKKLVFNAQLQMNDGLLVQAIANAASITFEEAVKDLDLLVKYWNLQLKNGKDISLLGVGVFKKLKDKSVAFHQDYSVNFLPEAYGLEPIHVVAQKKGNIKEKISRQIIDSAVPSAKKEGMTWRQVAAAVVLPVLGASTLFFSLNLGSGNVTQMNWNPFASSSKETLAVKEVHADVVINLSAQKSQSNDELLAMYTKKAVEQNAAKHKVLADSTSVVKRIVKEEVSINTSANYHVIAGCFANEENAAKYLEEIKAAGFDAHLVGKTPNGLTRVAYSSYSTRNEALQGLSKAKEHSKDAWISAE